MSRFKIQSLIQCVQTKLDSIKNNQFVEMGSILAKLNILALKDNYLFEIKRNRTKPEQIMLTGAKNYQHIMFKDMSADSFLLSAGISEHWPHGRGCYHSEDR